MIKSKFLCIAIFVFSAAIRIWAANADQPPLYVPPKFEKPPAEIAGSTRYVYKQTKDFALPIYVFSPSGNTSDPTPAVVFFHGSGWHSGTVIQFVEHARRLAALGICAAVAEYRVKVDYNATPFDSVADAKSAVRWLRAQANKLHLDPHRIATAGGSAGAHIALCTAVFDGQYDDPLDNLAISARPDLVILFASVTDTTKQDFEDKPNPLFEGRELEISPIHHLKHGMPPVQIFHGAADPWEPVSRAIRFADAMEKNGDECDLISFAGRTHFFYNHPAYYTKYPDFAPNLSHNDFELCLLLMTRFFRSHGFLHDRPIVVSENPIGASAK